MKAARIDHSKRLQQVLSLLQRGGQHSTRDIIQATGSCAINSIAAELLDNGYTVDCQRKGNVWFYSMPEKRDYQPPAKRHWEDKSRYNSFHREG